LYEPVVLAIEKDGVGAADAPPVDTLVLEALPVPKRFGEAGVFAAPPPMFPNENVLADG
jgi:hypothetical protein